jgi:hypothetical protein
MTTALTTALRRTIATAVFGALLAGLTVPVPAHARVFVGFGFPLYFGPPAYFPPPYYPPYFPPAYYPPPPQPYYPPPAAYAPRSSGPYGQSCYAGDAVCPMEHPVGSGSACYCTTAQGRVWGRAS